MPTQAADLEVYAGDRYTWRFRLSDADGPLDLSDWSWRAMWRVRDTDRTVVELVVDDSQSNTGWVSIIVSPAASAKMSVNGVWDLEGTLIDGDVRTWLRGRTIGTQDVTRG